LKQLKIYIAGHKGMVGSAIFRLLKKKRGIKIIVKNRSELDLTNQREVQNFFENEKPDQVYLAAAKVGGIYGNSIYPAEFIYENTMIESNIINSSFKNGVKKLLFLGSSCIYPKLAHQPMKEEELLNGQLEPTNEFYAISKILGIKLCQSYNRQYGDSHGIDYRCIMPANLYGPNDNYDLENCHVIPALIRKFHEAKEKKEKNVIVWGTGNPKREFLYVDDLAQACYHVMNLNKDKYIQVTRPNFFLNVGTGLDLSIKELAFKIKKIVKYKGEIIFDKKKPDGVTRKLLDTKRIEKSGWKYKTKFKVGLHKTYKDFKKLSLKKFSNHSVKSITPSFKFPLVKSSWDLSEHNVFKKIIDSDNYTMGLKTKLFEKHFADYFGTKYSVMVNSGSSANLIMIASLFYISKNKLVRGDEVIVPAVSWSTTFFPLYQYGLKLIFVDIDINTLNYDLEKLKKAISKKTRVILAVNLLGNPNDFIKIKKIIKNQNIFLLEDNCQSMGAIFNKKYTGTFGLMGTFSSFFSHHINTMEGGIVVTNNQEIYQILLSLRAHGWTRDLPNINYLKNKTGNSFSDSFCFVLPGYNLRPLEFSAALGIEQLKKLSNIVVGRQKNAILFKKLMSDHKDIIIQQEIGKSSWFGFSLIIRPGSKLTRANLLTRLKKLGFETRPISAGNFARNPVLRYFDFKISCDLKNADYIDKNGLVIGNNHSDLTEAINKLKYI
jgi:CDP-6-deoxy-D-xylo-4-hexulose-3-dehydrase